LLKTGPPFVDGGAKEAQRVLKYSTPPKFLSGTIRVRHKKFMGDGCAADEKQAWAREPGTSDTASRVADPSHHQDGTEARGRAVVPSGGGFHEIA